MEDHEHCQGGLLAHGIRTGDFGMQVGGVSVSACVILPSEVRNSLLQ